MRTTFNLDDDLLGEAQRLTGMTERTALIHAGLRALIERESARRLARLLARLPSAPMATHTEALDFLERRALMGRGIGFIDVHLLASAALAAPASFWTRDRRLAAIAAELRLAYA